MPSVDPKNAPRSTLPPALQELLVREAVFLMSRKRISDALASAEQQTSSGSFARPLLSLFARKDNRNKRREEVDNVAVLRAGIKKLDDAYPQLETCVERSLENYLREHDAEYANGLAASRFIDDWHRLLAQFELDTSHLLGALNALPAHFDALPAGAACGSTPESRQAIDEAVAFGRALQEDITFVNKIADAQRIRAGIDNITLYRQPERNWRGSIHSLHFVLPSLALDSIQSLEADINEVAEKVRAAIQGECQLASYVVGYGVTSYHRRVWASLREAAPLQVNPDNMEVILSETEELMDSGRLKEWRPTRPEPTAPTPITAAAPPPSIAPVAGRPPSVPRPAAAVPAAPPPVVPGPSLRLTRSPDLKLPSRTAPPVVPATSSPKPPPAPAAEAPLPATTASSTESQDSLADLTAERNRLEQILLETRASLTEREQFLSESEARLMQVSQAQIEREVDLEQREEQLRDLEKRLRQMQSSLSSQPAAPAPAPAPAVAKVFDEFNE
ncbi:MAG: hypothetical protein JNN01_26945 [Opitutaceae bacterium]|nr:hypothetical protein [Opitutaceae bacterium]